MLRFLPLLATIAAAPLADEAAPGPAGTRWAQLTIRERIIIHVPRLRPAPPAAPLPPIVRWQEKRGERCVPMNALAGALVPAPGRVDFVLAGGARVRARLDNDCHALDFYSGFYVRPSADGMMCAGRDEVRTRSGGVCPIRGFRRLVPRP